jgi:hypothetical protein
MRPQRWQAEAAPQPTSILPQSPAAELAYALNKAGVSTLVMAPELKGTSFVDLAESIRWVRISSVQDGLTSAAAYSRPQNRPRGCGRNVVCCCTRRCRLPLLACRDKTPQLRHKVVLGPDAPEGACSMARHQRADPPGSSCGAG